MARKLINATSILLILIFLAIVVTGVFLYLQLRTDSVQAVISQGGVVRTLVVAHEENDPFLSVLMLYNPQTKRLALLDIPSSVGMVLRPLGRVDGVGAVFDGTDSDVYRRQIEQLTGVAIPFLISLDQQQLQHLVDLLGGLELFIITDYSDSDRADALLMPSGLVRLDGQRAVRFLRNAGDSDNDLERVGRRQSFVQAMLREIQSQNEFLLHPDVVPLRDRYMTTELESRAISSFFRTLGQIDPERVVRRRIQGTVRTVDVAGQPRELLFPHFEGQWLQQSVQQVEQTIAGAVEDFAETVVVTVEILNGTGRTGLARRTAELYEGLGFEVVRVGNADSTDVTHTLVIDRRGFGDLAEQAANVINARRLVTDVEADSEIDVTVILGGDFDGSTVRATGN